jgi:isoleucyl-tRNA synthetase
MEELNVKNITYVKDLSTYMNFQVKPNYKTSGPIFGPKIKLFENVLSNISNDDISKLNNN